MVFPEEQSDTNMVCNTVLMTSMAFMSAEFK